MPALGQWALHKEKVMEEEKIMPEGCQLIDIPSVVDARGSLAFAESLGCVPFPIARVFWIYDVPFGMQRGGHAHWSCAEVVVAVRGAFTMVVDDGRVRSEIRMDSPSRGILIPAGVWCELRDFASDSLLVVMASEPYDATGYVHNYEEYLKAKRG